MIKRLFALCLAAVLASAATKAADRPPNIVLIISDDHGWQDYGFMGHPYIRTPNLDRLASQSLLYTRGYVPTALCSPSLATIITGRYPQDHRITGNDPPAPPGGKTGDWRNHPVYVAAWDDLRSLIRRVPTLPRLLGRKNYASLQTGKWWMGSYEDGGFTDGMTHGDRRRGGRHGDDGLSIGRTTMQPIYDFIARARSEARPFFVWYAPMLPHSPHDAPERLVDGYRDKAPSLEHARYWANVEWLDETCGELLAHLDRQGVADDTLVLYVADNGWVQSPEGDSRSLRSKRTPYDAGIRTPIMVRWPRKVKPQRSERLAGSIDIMPTLLAAAGVRAPSGLPGINLLDSAALRRRDTLYGACFTHDIVDLGDPAANVLSRWVIGGEWKLIVPCPGRSGEGVPSHPLLYRIAADPEERRNLAGEQPSRLERLHRLLDAWWNP
ncbi:MAG: sulfatase [Acidobacteria bacterium]|nr:sulfatase [Acidobacteriota bacterium]